MRLWKNRNIKLFTDILNMLGRDKFTNKIIRVNDIRVVIILYSAVRFARINEFIQVRFVFNFIKANVMRSKYPR